MSGPAAPSEVMPRGWRAPVVTALAVTATAFPFLWNRDFGWFLFGLFFYLPTLAATVLLAVIAAIFFGRLRLTILRTVAVTAVFLTLLYGMSIYEHDRITFLFWFPSHWKTLQSQRGQDRLIAAWDSWGMAGSTNDTYLVSNPSDEIGTTEAATRWLKRLNLPCEATNAQRMLPRVYMLTTYNCPLQ